MKKFRSVAVAAVLVSGIFAGAAQAVSVSGTTVDYTFDDTLLGLFGNWSIAGDKLSFDPTNFAASSVSGFALPVHATTPLITVKAKTGFSLQDANLHEQGDYLKITGNTLVTVTGQFILNGSNPPGFSAGDLSTVSLTTNPWEVNASGSLSGDTGTIKLQNILIAAVLTTDPGLAFIEKKLVDIWVTTAPTSVPLPPAAWMLGSALVGLVTVGRRKLGG